MVHVIPLSVGQRRRDAGNPVQGPDSPPLGEAVQPLDDEWQALAGHYQLRQAQQQGFDTEIAARRLNGQLAQAEADAVANAAADGAGLHDAIYGQLDPRTGQVVKTGLFDTLFDDFVKQAPAELRPGLASRKPALREAGSIRMALQQNQRRRDYEQAEVDTALKTGAIAIGNADPDDHVAFEAARQEGLDLIDKMGVDPGIRQQMAKEWFSTAAKARFEALIARDPQRALDMFGVGGQGETSEGDASGVQPITWGLASGNPEAAVATGDRVGKPTPDQRVAQAFRDDIPPEDRPALAQQAWAADAARQVEMRASISLAEQNAPAAIRETGSYSGPTFTPEQFVALHGSTEGGRRSQAFNQALDVSRQFYGMRTMSNDAVQVMVKESAPKAGSATPEQDRARRDAIATAADLTLKERQDDPGGYVRKVFPGLDAAWNMVVESGSSDPSAYGKAMAISIAAQKQLGIENLQPLPQAVAQDIAETLNNEDVSQRDKNVLLDRLRSGVPDAGVRAALFQQLTRARVSRPDRIDPVMTAATRETAQEAEQELAPVPLGQEDFDKRARPFFQDEGARQKSKEVTFATIVSRKGVRDKLIVPPRIKRDVNGILQSAVIDESKLAFDPEGPGEWGAFFGDPIGAVYGKIASSRAGSIKGWNNEGDAKRHAAWNADMTQSIGVERAKTFADAHEISVPDPDPERTMDLINNHNARELAEALKDTDLTPNDIADLAFRFGYLQSEPVHMRKK
ncbi:DUF6973 domain-containing protein [Mesorhizobium comanense]|uniref:DUF6973 domain-containing protein n=1 Tax=Mesorhizobium comanense TaxID=2502215 RepID=UPI001AEDB0AB|nr:hypothetical protein [Mesorhizobium comanense]